MPELPEVETTRRGIEPHILRLAIDRVIIREARLRWPVPDALRTDLPEQQFTAINRRGKYLLLHSKPGTLIIHLGMSGSLRLVNESTPFRKHDHVDFVFRNRLCLRYHDPRRFGCILWTTGNPEEHVLLAAMGPEPLSSQFNGEYLYELARNRKISIKALLMDSRVVTGVGNIYANEALFLSGIDPRRAAGRISRPRLNDLCAAISTVLNRSIQQGGTTLRDFVNEKGQAGYFQQALNVYNRSGQPCPRCGSPIRKCRTGQRS
ncbi:MAG: bifunctional DNA-formamidopyrimidine glycosylase/DNA-(apurinic or apyrimidinic site) lyase, partial [Methylococcaceae bacterium]|nr:bifunctional DNA-formamidopyrimidine glycosylase/DNA-(apurinic or apyrimidinic site) lyase [Methylococcaceae bacterium]